MQTNNQNTDSGLFRLIADGDQPAFAEIYNRYADPLYAYAYKILHSEFWAEEIVQTLFMQLWASRAQLIDIENPSSYLFRIAANRCIDWMRKNASEVKLQYHLSRREPSRRNEVEEEFDYRTSERLIREAVKMLPEQRRKVYQLQTDEGMNYAQIAETLDISVHTVRNQLAKAHQSIRQFLLEHGSLLSLLILFC